MRIAVAGLVLILGACSSSELVLDEYMIGTTTFVETHCSAADPVLRSSRADGLPLQGQTEPERVERIVIEARQEILTAYGAVDVLAVARNGDVRSNAGGVLTTAEATDSQILVVLSGDALCPVAAGDWNGIPLVFYREGFVE